MSEPLNIAIVGVGGMLPGAATPADFWANLLAGRDCSRDVPPGRWPIDPASVLQPGGPAADKTYSLRGYFLDSVPHDPAVDPNLDPLFHLAAKASRSAWNDARMGSVDRRRVGVVLGSIALPTEKISALSREVLAALDVLKTDSSPTAELNSTLAMMRRNIELESQLIDDLLDLTRIEKDKLQLDFESVDAHQAIANVIEICASEANAKKLRVQVDLQATDFHVMADPAKFQQIIWNLFKNAIKFTGEGGVITISSANHLPQILTIGVSDTGIGIEPEIMERIFNPFEQGERSFQRRFGGLGLGLTISKSLAQAHGASLIAKSEGLNRGATFLLTMKTAALDEVSAKPLVARDPAAPTSLRILLVDDHPDTCAALERLLTLRGHSVVAAHSMRTALAAAARDSFDLLISDVGLPDGNGMDLLRYLRAMRPIRGIAISGFGMDADVSKSLEAGFAEHLVKPVKLEKLEAAMQHAMSGAG